MIKSKFTIIFILLVSSFFVKGNSTDTLLIVLKDELFDEMKELKQKEFPPYYMDFRVSDMQYYAVSTFNGSVINVTNENQRFFKPNIRIGDYSFDNTHQLENAMDAYNHPFSEYVEPILPLENNIDIIKFKIWQNTNHLYQTSVFEYKNKLEAKQKSGNDTVYDFSQEPVEKYIENPLPDDFFTFDNKYWEDKLTFLDSVFASTEHYYLGGSSFTFRILRNYFVSTEGTEIVQNETYCSLYITAIMRLDDDEMIPISISFNTITPDGLPDQSALKQIIDNKIKFMQQLAEAPKAEPYAGPALLSAEATGVFFHEIFGHRIEGHRLNDFFDSKTFKAKLGEKILPEYLSVISDPTIKNYEGLELIGHYKYDDQGVKAQRVVNVDKGILKNFLMSRKPIEDFNQSNGHGRANIFLDPESRQSNLLVLSKKGFSDKIMRKKLIKECKKQNKPYGYYFKSVSGGFTNTMVFAPDYFNVLPIEVYKIYTDGRPDELVRSVNLIGTPLLMFSEILAVGDQYGVFSGYCGAESGNIPVSAIAPALLVNKIETQKSYTVKPEWPIISYPRKK